jgi:hypothetical protein
MSRHHQPTFADLPPLQQGEARRDAGMEATIEANERWHDRATAWITSLPLGALLTSDDLRDAMGEDVPKSGNSYGACMSGAERRGILEVVGMTPSRIPTNNARRILRYRRVEK